jgi:hypothetical protein
VVGGGSEGTRLVSVRGGGGVTLGGSIAGVLRGGQHG